MKRTYLSLITLAAFALVLASCQAQPTAAPAPETVDVDEQVAKGKGDSRLADDAEDSTEEDREASTGKEGESLRLKTVPIMDAYGWGEPVVAQTLLVPSDWSVQGGVRWNVSSVCVGDMIEEHFLASSPDGEVVFEILPALFWQWGNDQITQLTIQMSGCKLAPPLNAVGVLEQYVIPEFRPDVRIREARPSPEAARAAFAEYYDLWGPLYEMQNASLKTDALSAIIEYKHSGNEYEEWITLTLAETVTPLISGPGYSYTAGHIYAFRAPKGQLEKYERLFATMMASVRNNPVWLHALARVISNVSVATSLEAGKRASIWQDAMNQVGEIRVKAWQQSQETLSRVAQSWSRGFRGVDAYIDPINQQTVELSSGYQSAWSNGRGEYILTTDPAFDPNVSLGPGSWQLMRRLP